MSLEKITAAIEGKNYSFTVETIPSEEPAVVYRAVPDNDDPLLQNVITGYVDYDDKGNVITGEDAKNGHAKEITDAIWQAIHRQVIHHEQA